MAKHLQLNLSKVTKADGSLDESSVKVLDRKDLEVFNAAQTRPVNAAVGDEAVSALLNWK